MNCPRPNVCQLGTVHWLQRGGCLREIGWVTLRIKLFKYIVVQCQGRVTSYFVILLFVKLFVILLLVIFENKSFLFSVNNEQPLQLGKSRDDKRFFKKIKENQGSLCFILFHFGVMAFLITYPFECDNSQNLPFVNCSVPCSPYQA